MGVAEAIDIIIVNRNNDSYLQACVAAIRENIDGTYNLIIVDNNSEDASRNWITEKAEHCILNDRNLGNAVALNQGIRAGRYPWVLIVDPHILIRDRMWLDKMWNYTIDNKIGVIEAKLEATKIVPPYGKYMFSGLCFTLIRRAVFNEVGLFDGRFPFNPKIEWWCRFEWSRWKTAYCSDTDLLFATKILDDKDKALNRKDIMLLHSKYTYDFINGTLMENERRRQKMVEDLITNKEGENA